MNGVVGETVSLAMPNKTERTEGEAMSTRKCQDCGAGTDCNGGRCEDCAMIARYQDRLEANDDDE